MITTAERRRRRPRRWTPEVTALESRALLTINGGLEVVAVHPAVLRPTSSGRAESVAVAGMIATNHPVRPAGFFFVTDEYRQYEPRVPVALSQNPVDFKKGWYYFSFSFTVKFPTKRSTNTPDGRHFNLFVGATDKDGTDGKTVRVLVPKVFPNTFPPPKPAAAAAVPKRHRA